jgi:hypothetical protein
MEDKHNNRCSSYDSLHNSDACIFFPNNKQKKFILANKISSLRVTCSLELRRTKRWRYKHPMFRNVTP